MNNSVNVIRSGLGATYDASLGAQAGGVINRAQSDVMDIPGDVATGQALEGAKDKLSGRSWWQRLKRDLQNLGDRPLTGLKVFKDMFVNTAVETIAPLRDSRFGAHLFKSGAEIRLEGALNRINREITTLNDIGQMPLQTIKMSVFGFDFGATLARAFVHELLGRCQQRDSEYYYSNARLEIVFAGLFDAVDRSAAELPPLEFALPLTNRIDDGGLIHSEVKAVLHLVAAHERRFYRRARLLGARHRNWREELMPGISEDIGGGLAPGEQKASNELALVSLHRMYRAAHASGAGLPGRRISRSCESAVTSGAEEPSFKSSWAGWTKSTAKREASGGGSKSMAHALLVHLKDWRSGKLC